MNSSQKRARLVGFIFDKLRIISIVGFLLQYIVFNLNSGIILL